MRLKKLLWTFRRHPILYKTRFKLLSRNVDQVDIENCNYNTINKKIDIPDYFREINTLVFNGNKPKSNFELVTQLSLWLFDNIKGGPGLSEPSDKALKIMLEGKGGVCSDMAQAFNNFCVLNDILVREWGTTRAPFDKAFGGHSFNEVFCKEFDKWVLIDVYNCTLFYKGKRATPLSVGELYHSLQQGDPVDYRSFNPSKKGEPSGAYRNFLHPDTIPFLICNYSNKTYDDYLNRFRPYLPIFVIHFLLYLLGKSYHYVFPVRDYKTIFT